MARLVAFLVEVLARGEGGWNIGSRGLSRSRHSLLASYQFVVNIRTEFVELCWRQAQKLIAGLVGSTTISVIATRYM